MTNTELTMTLQGVKIELTSLGQMINGLRAEIEKKSRFENIPEWVTLDLAVSLKGGAALNTLQSKLFLQPCCGRNYKLVGGRKCWPREEVLRWLTITDSELKNYAAEFKVAIPDNYERRSA